ncbi:pectinesterase family protein [Uliginosibacterium sp. 31-12]|uniref:pectinesterase family protein n=1 Tax=Uliginosibacterium sp. 31-12 TaxID=3062781 RepID=UPI0026E314C5|nr:pectinesterase family protein [Uliginosibacterium sp. 31-12]MDO6387105.1 pectinesterase family protein [Uliginosibacterium sp. 31-12]
MIAAIRRTLGVLCLGSAMLGLLAACGGGGSSGTNSTSSSGNNGGSAASSQATSNSASSQSEGDSASSAAAQTSAASALSVPVGVTGWASQGTGTTGGAGAPASNIYVVHNRAELKAALANQNSPTYATNATTAKSEAKIIYVVGSIYGTDLGNGQFANEAYYKTLTTTYKNINNWDFEAYIGYVTAQATGGTATTEQTAAASARSIMQNAQKAQIEFSVPSNTTILGVGADAKIIDGFLTVNATSNIVIRNLEFQAPQDLGTSYTWTAGKEEWNAKFKAINMVTGKQIWIDHCTFSDGANFDSKEVRTINGVTKHVQRHDGLLDIEDSSDYVTVSYSIFKNHDKTNMVGGSGDGNGAKERAYNRLTFSNNIWQDTTQRAPRARFGQIHLYNNSYSGNTDSADYPVSYYVGMGAESRILSEANVFDMSGSKATVARVMSNLNGYQFKDVGSWFNGVAASAELEAAAKAALDARWNDARKAADGSSTPTADKINSVFTLAAYTNQLGWTPAYSYTPGSSANVVRAHNLVNAGAGKLPVTAASSTRPMLDDTAASNATVAKALAGSDAWAPQSVNAGQPNAGRLYPAGFTADFIVTKDGSTPYSTIQSALNAASTSTAARVYIQVKAGDYNEQLIVSNTAAAITLYSSEADATKVRIYNALSQGSLGASYNTFVTNSTYTGNTDATTLYNACSKKTGSVGKECSATIRVRNNGFQLVNLSVENAWVETGSSDQAVAVMVDKADKVVLDGVRLISNQDTLYLANSGKRVYVTASDISGDVDFIFGAGIGVFEGSTIRTLGTRKPSGTSITSPSTTASTQTVGLLFNNSVFLADSATTDNSIYLARQWDDSATDAPGKVLVRNSVLGKHVALTSGPWSPTVIGGSATQYTYLNEYRNWDEVQKASSSATSSAAASSAAASSASSSSATASSSATSSVSSSVATGSGSNTPITGSTTLTNAYVASGLPVTVSTSYDSVNGKYTLVSAGIMGGTTDSLQFSYQQIAGDFTMIARLTSLEAVPTGLSTGNWRAGLMVRNSLADNSRYYGLLMRSIPRLQWEQRKTDGDVTSTGTLSPSYTTAIGNSAPLFLKLVRSGNSITVSYSSDGGVTWLGSKTQDFTATGYSALDSTVYVGLAGVSGSTTVTSTSVFDFVSITTP